MNHEMKTYRPPSSGQQHTYHPPQVCCTCGWVGTSQRTHVECVREWESHVASVFARRWEDGRYRK